MNKWIQLNLQEGGPTASQPLYRSCPEWATGTQARCVVSRDGKPKIQTSISNQTTQPNRIIHYHHLRPQRTYSSGSQTAAVPFYGWHDQLKQLTRPECKQKSLNITIQENLAGGHAHLSPLFSSQSPVDAQMRKGERKEVQWPNLAAMRQTNGDGRSGRLISITHKYVHFLHFLRIYKCICFVTFSYVLLMRLYRHWLPPLILDHSREKWYFYISLVCIFSLN
jgi:hypothetical protein